MIISVTSHRGHHEAVVENDTARMVFDRLTGKRKEPLPAAVRTKIPDTWAELDALWGGTGGGYTALTREADGKMSDSKEFDPHAEEIAFIAPVTGG